MDETREVSKPMVSDSIFAGLSDRQAAFLYWHATRPRWAKRLMDLLTKLRLEGMIAAYYIRRVEPPELKPQELSVADKIFIAWVRSLPRWKRKVLYWTACLGLYGIVYSYYINDMGWHDEEV